MFERAGKSILVVEDDQDIRDALIHALESEGYSVTSAGNGQEALDALLASPPHYPNLILLDLMMPVMDGWQFRAEQLRRPELFSIPVVVISAHTRIQHKAGLEGVAAFMRKPVELNALYEMARKHCAQSRT